jgi:hypothetical protein
VAPQHSFTEKYAVWQICINLIYISADPYENEQ